MISCPKHNVLKGSQSEGSADEIPMELDLTSAGPPISDDDSDTETRERKCVVVSILTLFLPVKFDSRINQQK